MGTEWVRVAELQRDDADGIMKDVAGHLLWEQVDHRWDSGSRLLVRKRDILYAMACLQAISQAYAEEAVQQR